tara:strand:- start:25 stop:486 length:462 start_codon:yes stop_codon:yes gene_type:complete
MNEEDMKAFVESYMKMPEMNPYEWDSYQKEENIHKNLYDDIYEEVMESGMDNEKYPKMFSVARDPDNLSDDIMIFTFAVQGNKIPDIFCNGSLWSHSYTTIEQAREFYVRLRNSGYKEHTEPVNGVYAYYRNKGMGPKLGNNAYGDSNYALNA